MMAAKKRPSRHLPTRPLNDTSSCESVLQELFSHYDLHRDGHICPEAFTSTQRLVKHLISGLAISRPMSATNVARASNRHSSPARVGNRSGHETNHVRSAGPSLGVVGTEIVGSVRGRPAHKARVPSPPVALARLRVDAPLRSPSFISYGSVEIEVHVTNWESFLHWQNKLLDASSKNGLEKQQRLMWLVSELNKLDETQLRSQFWQKRRAAIKKIHEEVDAACQLASSGDPLSGMSKVVAALQHIQGILHEEGSQVHEGNLATAATLKGRQKLTELKAQWRSDFAAAVEGECSCAVVTERLEAAADILSEEELAPYFENLEQMRKPFDLKVWTLAGSETIVKVSRISTVLGLKDMLATAFDVLPYRLGLSSNDGEVLSDAKTLEYYGITGDDASVSVVIGQANKYRELSHEDFVELVVAKRVDSRERASRRLPEASDEWEFRQQYVPRLIEVEEREERKRQREERIRLKRESIAAKAKHVIESLGESSEAEAQLGSMASAAEAECRKRAERAMAIKADAQQDLDEALPPLEVAYQALHSVCKRDLAEMNSFSKPPPLVLTVVEAVHILIFGRKCQSWSEAMKMLRNPRFLDDMLRYDKDSISPEIIAQLEPYIARDDFDPDVVRRISQPAADFCSWVRAMHIYYIIAQRVWPKRSALHAAEEDLEEVMQEHQAWASHLKELQVVIASIAFPT